MYKIIDEIMHSITRLGIEQKMNVPHGIRKMIRLALERDEDGYAHSMGEIREDNERLNACLKELKEEIDGLGSQNTYDYNTIKTLTQERDKLSSANDRLIRERDEAREQHVSACRAVADWKKQRNQAIEGQNDLRGELEQSCERVLELRGQRDEQTDRLANALNEIIELKKQLLDANIQTNGFIKNHHMHELANEITSLKQELESANTRVSELKTDRNIAVRGQHQLREELVELRRRMEEPGTGALTIKALKQDLANRDDTIATRTQERDHYKREVESLKSVGYAQHLLDECDELNKQLVIKDELVADQRKELENVAKIYRANSETAYSLSAEVNDLKAQLKGRDHEIKQLNDHAREQHHKLPTYTALAAVNDELHETIESLENQLDEINEQLSEVPVGSVRQLIAWRNTAQGAFKEVDAELKKVCDERDAIQTAHDKLLEDLPISDECRHGCKYDSMLDKWGEERTLFVKRVKELEEAVDTLSTHPLAPRLRKYRNELRESEEQNSKHVEANNKMADCIADLRQQNARKEDKIDVLTKQLKVALGGSVEDVNVHMKAGYAAAYTQVMLDNLDKKIKELSEIKQAIGRIVRK